MMASISVKGTVERMFFNGLGVEIAEKSTNQKGEIVTKKYTAWFTEPVEFVVGTVGKFSGLLTTKIEDWLEKDGSPKKDFNGNPGRSIRISINNARYTELGLNSPSMPKSHLDIQHEPRSSMTADAWNPPMTAIPDEMPF